MCRWTTSWAKVVFTKSLQFNKKYSAHAQACEARNALLQLVKEGLRWLKDRHRHGPFPDCACTEALQRLWGNRSFICTEQAVWVQLRSPVKKKDLGSFLRRTGRWNPVDELSRNIGVKTAGLKIESQCLCDIRFPLLSRARSPLCDGSVTVEFQRNKINP